MYKVCVIMSTYNGGEFVREQIESVLSQELVDVELYVRDDGSVDNTKEILNQLAMTDSRIIVSEDQDNLGFANSFFKALKDAPDADYYAFSDQDDYWYPEKLIKSIELIADAPYNGLAFMNSMLTDHLLNPQVIQYNKNKQIPSKYNSFFQSVSSGFLMVFHKSLRELSKRVDSIPISHDMFIGSLALFFGTVKYDGHVVVLHRRLNNSVSNVKGIKLLKSRFYSMIHDRGVAKSFGQMMLQYYNSLLTSDDLQYFTDLCNYRSSIKSKLRILLNRNIAYPGLFGIIVIKIKILLNRF